MSGLSASERVAGARPLFPEEDLDEVLAQIREVLRSGRLILGPRTRELEAEWARRTGVAHAVALSSCSAALEIAMRHVGVAGREVVVPTNTFVATVHAAVNAGARVRFVDIDARDFNLDVSQALSLLGPATAAVIVVHIAGFVPHGFDGLRDECRRRGIVLVEDCAHAHGSELQGRWAGGLGDVGCFSFYPTKVLTSGVGGMLTTDDAALADFARSLRHHGQGPSLEDIVNAGNDWLMDEVRAVLALSQVRRLDQFLDRRRAIARLYDGALAADPRITRPVAAAGTRPAYYKYPVLLPDAADRDRLRRELNERGIEIGALYSPPAHLMPVFQRTLGTAAGMLPIAESLLPRQICLPMHAAVTPEQAERSVRELRSALDRQL
jgi:dTDP-4-amino-4,6-dideoxygalactose transaminase